MWHWVEAVVVLFHAYEFVFKIISFIVSPAANLVQFRRAAKDKKELIEAAKKLGAETVKSEHALAALSAKESELESARQLVTDREDRAARLEADIVRLTEGSQELWKIRPAQPFPEYENWLRKPDGAKIITVGNLKGGVGKTTIAANFAAYVAERLGKPVLLIDLDYQGSLSGMMLSSAGITEVGSNVDSILAEDADVATLIRARVHLAAEPEHRGLNRGWIVPADYPLAKTENRLLLQAIVKDGQSIDVRYRLAHILLNPQVREQYAAIIIDVPPRMTLGAVNAFVASHYYLVPTILDELSSGAVEPFLKNMTDISKDLKLDLKLAGIVSSMTAEGNLRPNEERVQNVLREMARSLFQTDVDYMIKRNIQRRAAIANEAGQELAYFLGAGGVPFKIMFDEVFDEISTRIGLKAPSV